MGGSIKKFRWVMPVLAAVKRLRQGPDITSYSGLSIVNSRAYSMETGTVPRDVLRRRVRVAEYYRVPPQKDRNWELELYNESRDT
jgi:hypothetical protein